VNSRRISRRRRSLIIVAVLVLETVAMRLRGYRIGGNLVVRCRRGHLFTTIWLPGASLKAVRLGWWRLQRCPVGNHWSIVTPVKESDLSDEEKRIAHDHRTSGSPNALGAAARTLGNIPEHRPREGCCFETVVSQQVADLDVRVAVVAVPDVTACSEE
jgi:hypothetical protein